MIYDYFRVTGAHDTVLNYADLFSVMLHDDNIQEFDTRWDEVLLSMSKIPSGDILEGSTNCEYVSMCNSKPYWDYTTLEIHKKISMPNYQRLQTMVKRGVWIRNFDCETLTPEKGKSKQVQWSRVERAQVALREEEEFAISGKKGQSARRS